MELQELQAIDERFYKEVSSEWERKSKRKIGEPELKIWDNSVEGSTHIIVVIVFHNISTIYNLFMKGDMRDTNTIDLLPTIGKWIGERS